MKLNYHLSIPEIMEFFSSEHQPFEEEWLKKAEQSVGAALPSVYRKFLLTYGGDPINDILHPINTSEEICTTYQCIAEELEGWEEAFQEAVEDGTESKYAGNDYFTLWKLPEEQWNQVTENYVLIWYENQGVWNAGFLLSDLLAGKPDAPVYMSTEDDFITFQKCAENTREFLLQIYVQAAYEYEDAMEGYQDPKEIRRLLTRAGIDIEKLSSDGSVGTCFNTETKELYLYFHKEQPQYEELVVINGMELDNQPLF